MFWCFYLLAFFLFWEMSSAAIGPKQQSGSAMSSYSKMRKKALKPGLNFTDYEAESSIQTLMRSIFNNYVKEAMPERPVVVSMDVLLFKVKSTVEKEGIFECVIGLIIEWRDKRMTWNPADYDNLTLLAFDSEKVWLPDIAMTNSAEHLYQISRDSRFIVRVNYDGTMKFVPTGTARTWCHLRLYTFPFDIQTCTLEFEAWSLDTSTMTFDGKSSLIIDSAFDSTQYFLCNYKTRTYLHTYNFSGETFTRVQIDLTVKRKSTFYVINLIFPCAVLSCIQLLVFILSSVDSTVDRIGFGTTNMLTLVVFQTIVTEEMPKTSDAVTALSKYIIALILMSALGIIESVVVERMLDMKKRPPARLVVRVLKTFPVLFRERSDPIIFKLFETKHRTHQETLNPSINICKSSRVLFSGSKHTPEVICDDKAPGTDNEMDDGNAAVSVRKSETYDSFLRTSFNGNYEILKESPINRSTSYQKAVTYDPLPSYRVSTDNEGVRDSTSTGSYRALPALIVSKRPSKNEIYATNARLWREVAYRIDFITFVICLSLVVLVPCGLFLPLAWFQPGCANLAERHSDD